MITKPTLAGLTSPEERRHREAVSLLRRAYLATYEREMQAQCVGVVGKDAVALEQLGRWVVSESGEGDLQPAVDRLVTGIFRTERYRKHGFPLRFVLADDPSVVARSATETPQGESLAHTALVLGYRARMKQVDVAWAGEQRDSTHIAACAVAVAAQAQHLGASVELVADAWLRAAFRDSGMLERLRSRFPLWRILAQSPELWLPDEDGVRDARARALRATLKAEGSLTPDEERELHELTDGEWESESMRRDREAREAEERERQRAESERHRLERRREQERELAEHRALKAQTDDVADHVRRLAVELAASPEEREDAEGAPWDELVTWALRKLREEQPAGEVDAELRQVDAELRRRLDAVVRDYYAESPRMYPHILCRCPMAWWRRAGFAPERADEAAE